MNTRASNGGGTVTPIEPTQQGFVGRLRTAMQYVTTGNAAWFGPRNPLPPVAPEEVAGRALDYPTGINQNLSPRSQEPVSFAQLRVLADSYDLMRLIIETRKDQVSRMKWSVRNKDLKIKPDKRCDEITKLLRSPDREHDWDTWVRALVEDMLVIDAATIYPRKTRGGDIYALDLVDGATIKRVIGQDGRTPLPPEPAYQQVLKGVTAASFTSDELFYRLRNWRVHRIYGYSPVEQVITTVNIALRRQMHQMQYYTEGNVPEALVGVPSTWTTQQIRAFQDHWDSMMEGNTAKRRKAKFVPGDMKYQPTREPTLKDMYDEWLARVVCFAFSVSPTPFIAQVNRATAEVAQDAALEEGLAPVLTWVKNTMDAIIARLFGYDDIEFVLADEVSIDPETRSRIHKTYIDAKVLTPDEVREEIGRDPLSDEDKVELETLTPAAPSPGGSGNSPPDNPNDNPDAQNDTQRGEYLGDMLKRSAPLPKAARRAAPINRERPAATKATKAILGATEAALSACLDEALEAVAHIGKSADDADKIAAALRLAGLDALADALASILTDLVKDAVSEAVTQIGMEDAKAIALANENAVAWAAEHAAELVGKKWVDGKLVDNPNAVYRIDEVTRDGVRSLVTQAIDEGWSNDRLAAELRSAWSFSSARAELIATTETAFADVQGNMFAYRQSGVVKKKKWVVGPAETLCPTCADNKKQGAIDFEATFASGHLAPPAHPRCKCDIVPLLK